MGADYSFYVKTIETHARAFFKVIIFSIAMGADYAFYVKTIETHVLQTIQMKLILLWV